jgi:hypothetical protein
MEAEYITAARALQIVMANVLLLLDIAKIKHTCQTNRQRPVT